MDSYDEIKGQLERYSGQPVDEVLPVLEAITDLNDDLANMRSAECILGSIEKVKQRLDDLAARYR